MFFIVPNGQVRPSLLSKNKDEQYHIDFARYCIGMANNGSQNRFIEKSQLNKAFYRSEQWINDEDLEGFFKDDSGQDRNRIKITKNIVKPVVQQYKGNAIRMSISFGVKSISPMAINRREGRLATMLLHTEVANKMGGQIKNDMKKVLPIGETEAETSQIFNNLYIDKYVEAMNDLLEYVAERNEFEHKQVQLSEELALSGLAVIRTFEYSGHQEFDLVQSENFFFDKSARKYDLSDGEFMGEVHFMSVSEVFEQYPDLTDKDKINIEEYAKVFSNSSQSQINTISGKANSFYNNGKIPVYRVYWKDGDSCEYGYVKDDYGYEYLTKVNHTYEGEDKPRYTDKDLIKSKSERAKKILGDKLKKRLFVDTLRTAVLIPNEIVSSGQYSGKKYQDILLEYGIAPYQETESIEFDSVKFPYKCYCWGYVDGEILSPIDDIISPQRFINRILSVAENQINNSRGSGTVIDTSVLGQLEEDEVMRNINQSKPLLINSKGLGVQNVVGSYDSTVKGGTMVLFNIIDTMGKLTQEITGVNEAIKGESMGNDQLVGVTQLMIQRGSLIQEPFYYAITNIYKQMYQSIASLGKRIYCDNERNIAIAVGDNGHRTIKITKDMKLEDFRCFVKRSNSEEVMYQAGDQMLLQLLQMQLIDDKIFANLYGRSTPNQVAIALRKAAGDRAELQRMQEQQQQQLAPQQEEAIQQQQAEEDYRRNVEMEEQKQFAKDAQRNKLKQQYINNLGKLAKDNPVLQNTFLNQMQIDLNEND